MSLQDFDRSLVKYNSKLKEISTDNIDYNALNNAVLIFFEEINALDKNYLEYYFINITKENVKKNLVQEYAFSYFLLLTIKNIRPPDFLARFFPEFVELESAPRSNWWIIRWLQIFIAWVIKPKPKFRNFPEAKKVLDALRDIRHRIRKINNKLLDVKLEMQFYKSLNLIEKKIIEPKASPLIYISIDEQHVINDWVIFYMQTLESDRHCKELLVEYSERNQTYSIEDFANLTASFETMLSLIKELENCAKEMDPKPLENDMHQLSQFILAEILFLHTVFKKEIKENVPLVVYDANDCDNESDISVTPNLEQLEPEENLMSESIFIAEQFDSGVSSEDESNSVQTTRSNSTSNITLFRLDPLPQVNNSEIPRLRINSF
ncbi:hypothetical protein FQR65_LT05205 [Abscondita terminalis]|nr:hypothetical protein FQR65_LT05205 [Abscondita terminalis]